MDVHRLLSAFLVLMLHRKSGWGLDTCDQCDCKLSSKEENDRAIFSVRTRCSSGSIEWSSAYGAIRLEVQPALGEDYRLCFVVHSHHTVTQVSQESVAWHPHRRHNYRRRLRELDTSSTMTPLVSAKGKSEEVCVVGRTRQSVLLFVEVERTNEFTGVPSVTLLYDVQPLPAAVLQDPMEECRPCTQEELLESYCTSDFVAVGRIHHTQPSVDHTDNTLIKVAVAQLIHQNSPVVRRVNRDDQFLFGTILAPDKCGVRPGKEDVDFLFTGRMRFGKVKLRCAPYFRDWLKISPMAECVYN